MVSLIGFGPGPSGSLQTVPEQGLRCISEDKSVSKCCSLQVCLSAERGPKPICFINISSA